MDCARSELDQFVGRLNHMSYIIMLTPPLPQSTLEAVVTSRQHHSKLVTIQPKLMEDLTLWKAILVKAADKGVSINLVVARQPRQHLLVRCLPIAH